MKSPFESGAKLLPYVTAKDRVKLPQTKSNLFYNMKKIQHGLFKSKVIITVTTIEQIH